MEEHTSRNGIWADIFPDGPVLDIMILDFEQKKNGGFTIALFSKQNCLPKQVFAVTEWLQSKVSLFLKRLPSKNL